jgi:ABC-type branched-subunit amino acid transport system substrate-binding protein
VGQASTKPRGDQRASKTAARAAPSLRAAAGVLALAAGLSAGCGDEGEDLSRGTAIGAIIPFTGVAAAGGANYERAMLLAIERINAQAAPGDTPLRLVVQDSHSTRERTLRGLAALEGERMIGLIGPERVELIDSVRAELVEPELAHLLPNSVTLGEFARHDAGVIVRPAPAAEFVGCALANRIYADRHTKLVVLHTQDRYRSAFASALVKAFESYRFGPDIGVGKALPLPDNADDYLATVSAALAEEPDAVVLAAEASVGAELVRAWSALAPYAVEWFFEPALRSDEFLRNVTPNTVEGAVGVSLALPDEALEFAGTFEERWDGETPLVESHFYFDAVTAIGLAAIAAEREVGRTPTAEEVSGHVLSIMRGPGESVSWKEIERAVDLVRRGEPVHYLGAAGRLAIDPDGLVQATFAIFEHWTIQEGRIRAERFGACPPGTIQP